MIRMFFVTLRGSVQYLLKYLACFIFWVCEFSILFAKLPTSPSWCDSPQIFGYAWLCVCLCIWEPLLPFWQCYICLHRLHGLWARSYQNSLYWYLGRATVNARRNFSFPNCYYLLNPFLLLEAFFLSPANACITYVWMSYAFTLNRRSAFQCHLPSWFCRVGTDHSTCCCWMMFWYFLFSITFKYNYSIYLLSPCNPVATCLHPENCWPSHITIPTVESSRSPVCSHDQHHASLSL